MAARRPKAAEPEIKWEPTEPPAPRRERRAGAVEAFLASPPPAGQWVLRAELGTAKSAASTASKARKRLGARARVVAEGTVVKACALPEGGEA
ncbi:MAG: hypothetical protein M3R38_06865 [Actinomycetota bacterium]|nr:hypothetical protein [Actinomycetota bacterium]